MTTITAEPAERAEKLFHSPASRSSQITTISTSLDRLGMP